MKHLAAVRPALSTVHCMRLNTLEASGNAHHWARVLRAAVHALRLMALQFVDPYVKSNKNDANDAEATVEAVRSNIHFVSPNLPSSQAAKQPSSEQQDMHACAGYAVAWSLAARS